MTPAGRLAAAAELIAAVGAEPRRPADAISNDWFRARRYIGGGDRRAIAERVWAMVRQRLRLEWHLHRVKAEPSARLLLGAHLILAEGWTAQRLEQEAFPGGQYALHRLDDQERRALAALVGRPLVHPDMREAVRLNIPDWLLPGFRERFGERLPEEAAAMDGPAPLDLRANLLRGTREAAVAALTAVGIEAAPTPLSPWGLRVAGRASVVATVAFRDGLIEDGPLVEGPESRD